MTSVDEPLEYIKRTRRYYQVLGYGASYVWAHYDDVPFVSLSKPLSKSRVAIVTTAAIFQPGKGDQGPGAPYNASAKFYDVYAMKCSEPPNLGISHVAIDRDHTSAEDIGTYFPLDALKLAAVEGRIGSTSSRFYGLPTNRSIRKTLEVDCQNLTEHCKADAIDAAILVPNCPVCHQSVSLAARHLENEGIASVIMGCARDIVEHVGVPRFLFNDFPLGNSAGLPHDRDNQYQIMILALDLLEQANGPRTTWRSPFHWSGDEDWKRDYSNPDLLSSEEIAQKRAAFDAGKAEAKTQQGRSS